MASTLPTSQPIPFSLSDLSQPDINLLTRILSQPPPPPPPTPTPASNPTALHALIRSLPTHLRAPLPHQKTITTLFPATTSLPPAAPLCRMHSPLNAQLIHTILTTLTTELGPRLHALTRPTLAPHLTASQALLLPRLQALHALWLPPAIFRARFGAEPLPQWAFQADACEACMLARVGAQKGAVVALRTVLVSRRQKGRPAPRLLRWVEGWLEAVAVGGQEAEALRVEAGVDGRALRAARRRAAAVAARTRGMGMVRGRELLGGEDGGGLERARGERAADGGCESEAEGGDFENEIIDLYAGRSSSSSYSSSSSSSSSSTDVPLPRRAEGARRGTELPTDADSDVVSDSSWQSGRRSGSPSLHSRRRPDQEMGEAEMRADKYRALLRSRASSDRPSSERRSGSTTWSAFLQR